MRGKWGAIFVAYEDIGLMASHFFHSMYMNFLVRQMETRMRGVKGGMQGLDEAHSQARTVHS